MKKLSYLLIISFLLSTVCGCMPAVDNIDNTQITSAEYAESTADDITVIEETIEEIITTFSPEATATPQTDPITEATEIPKTEPVPETTEPAPIIPLISVSTADELIALSKDKELSAGSVIRIVKGITVDEPIIFTLPISFSIEADLICNAPITIETSEEGSIDISLSPTVSSDTIDIRFDSPCCDLYWLSGSPFSDDEYAAEISNLRSYNGTSLREKYGLGGEGAKKISSFSADAGENALLDSAISWSVEGNVIYTAISYLVNFNALKDAVISIEYSDGTKTSQVLDLTENEKLIRIIDEKGKERVYKIVTDRITYNLPVIYIDIDDGAEVTSKEEYLTAKIRIDTDGAYGNFTSLPTTSVSIRGRGHFSWQFDKTPYKLKFEKKTSVLDMSAAKDWVLLANYVDRSLIQNYVAMEMGKVMTNIPYHTSQYPVDVFVNGTYRGVYTCGEQLEVKKDRINLEESYTEVDTDYLLEIGGNDDGDVLGRDYFHSYVLKYVKIKHPDSTKLTEEQIDYLISYVNKADLAVRSLTNYEDYIDVDSLIDWVIIHELTYNLDCCFRRSCYLIKEKGGKLKMGPIWDFDLGFGNYRRYTTDNWATVGSDGGYVWISWMNYLMQDEAFMKRFTDRWNEIKEPLITTAITSVETMSELVKPSADMNFTVWDILGKDVLSQPAAHKKYDTYEKMIGRLKDFLTNRYKWIDKQLDK